MVDLTHWDFAEYFSGYEAAALILGLEPRDSDTEEWRVSVVTDRMRLHYQYAIAQISSDFDDTAINAQIALPSVKSDGLNRRYWLGGEETNLSDWLNSWQSNFDTQDFRRDSIARWLRAIGMKSIYQFDRTQSPKHEAVIETDIDPADLPDELSAANIAFRAVTKGHGDPAATFKNRLIDYLGSNFPSLNSEAVQRIATVANPDKAPGRKKRNAE